MRPAAVLFLGLVLSVCGTKDALKEITLEKASVRPAAKGTISAGYLTIRNHRTTPEVLIGAECDCARSVEVHRMLHEGLTMKMEPVVELAVPAGTAVTLEPHGIHLMLIDLQRDLAVQGRVKLTLKFRGSGSRTIEATVGEP